MSHSRAPVGTPSRRTLVLAALCLAAAALAPACRDRDANVPIVDVFTPFEQGGRVPFTYILKNPDTSFAEVAVSFVRFGSPFFEFCTVAEGSEPIIGLTASPGGTQHIFTWDALADLGPGDHIVFVQMIPRIGGQIGQAGTTINFSVRNHDLAFPIGGPGEPALDVAASPSADGGVLVTGGASATGRTDALPPQGQALEPRADLLTPRRRHAQVTALVDPAGGVAPVVLGGEALTGGAIAGVERYEQDLDLWTALAPLSTARTAMQATRLATGSHILLSGGRGAGGGLLAGDVIYDAAQTGALASEQLAIGSGAARTGHSATLLPDGRVLVAGGTDASGDPLDSTLILTFAPPPGASASYVAGPTLTEPRTGHAALVLGDSLVIVGGTGTGGQVLDTIEAIDSSLPGGAIFSQLLDAQSGDPVRLSTPRSGLRAVALGETQAVLSGGTDGTASQSTIERLDLPNTRVALARLPMADRRSGHVAVPLGAGQMLTLGGGTDSADAYLPPTVLGSQGVEPEMTRPLGRDEHQLTLLGDGRVLISGGTDGVSESATSTLRALGSAELYDPGALAGQRLSTTGSMQEARRRHAAVLGADGRVLVAGGLGIDGDPLASVELFDGATFATSTLALPEARFDLAAARGPSGRVYLIGGSTTTAALSRTDEVLVLESAGAGSFATGPSLQRARSAPLILTLGDGRILVAGGDAQGTIEVLDEGDTTQTAFGTWTLVASTLGGAVRGIAAAQLPDGRVVFAGGFDASGVPQDEVFVLDPTTLVLTAQVTLLSRPRGGAVCVPIAGVGTFLVCGGATARPAGGISPLATRRTASIERYSLDAASGLGETVPGADPDLTSVMESAPAQRLSDASFLIVGGRGVDGTVRAAAERVRP